jgi:hypothetical protein
MSDDSPPGRLRHPSTYNNWVLDAGPLSAIVTHTCLKLDLGDMRYREDGTMPYFRCVALSTEITNLGCAITVMRSDAFR